MNHALALVAYYGKTRLTLKETAHCMCLSYQTARHMRAAGTFPIPMAGSPLTADVEDVGRHLESLTRLSRGEKDAGEASGET